MFAPHVATFVTAPTMQFQIFCGVCVTIVTMPVSMVFITSLALVCIFKPHVATLVTASTMLFQIFCGSSFTILIILLTNSVMTVPPFSCILAPHSAIFVMPSAIAPAICPGSSASFPMIVLTSCPAADKILGKPDIKPDTIAVMIFGIAAISRGSAFIMPSTSATTMSPALSKICGMPSTSASMIAVMISGSASIITGSAAIIPSASPVTSCNAASTSIGTFSTKVCTIVSTAEITLGISCGSASPSPLASPAMICVAPSASDGTSSTMPLISVVIISVALSVSVGIASIMPSTSDVIMSTPACTIVGALSTMPSTSPVTSSTAKPVICGSISASPLTMFPSASPKLCASFPMSPPASAAPCCNSFANCEKIGNACSPIGIIKLVCNILPAPCIASPNVSYFTALICPIASVVLLISPSTLISDVQASAPISSHIVPISPTPAVYCKLSSSQFFSASLIWFIASFALSPPAWNFPTISSALSPRLVRYSFAVPSFIRILNSLKASPILSMLHTPVSAPFLIELNISSALNPACAYWLLYSFITSSKSPFWFSPSCAPCAMRLYASSPLIPNFCISWVAALVLSATSMSNVSRRVNAFVVIFSSSSAPRSPACCFTVAIEAAISSKPSP